MEIDLNGTIEKIGVRVDEVQEVYEVTADKIEEVPPMFRGDKYNYILAVSKEEAKTRLLLDIIRLLMAPQQLT